MKAATYGECALCDREIDPVIAASKEVKIFLAVWIVFGAFLALLAIGIA